MCLATQVSIIVWTEGPAVKEEVTDLKCGEVEKKQVDGAGVKPGGETVLAVKKVENEDTKKGRKRSKYKNNSEDKTR